MIPETPSHLGTPGLPTHSSQLSIQIVEQTPTKPLLSSQRMQSSPAPTPNLHSSHLVTPAQRTRNSPWTQQAVNQTPQQQLIPTQPITPTSYPSSPSLNFPARPPSQAPALRTQTQFSPILYDPSSAPSQMSAAHGHARLRATQAQASGSNDIVHQYVVRARRIIGRVCGCCFAQERLHIVNTGENCSDVVRWKCFKCYSCLREHHTRRCPFPLIEYARQNKNQYCHQCGILQEIHHVLPNGFCSSRTSKILKGFVATVRRENSRQFEEQTGHVSTSGTLLEAAINPAQSSNSVQGWVEWLMVLSNDGFHGESFDRPLSAEY